MVETTWKEPGTLNDQVEPSHTTWNTHLRPSCKEEINLCNPRQCILGSLYYNSMQPGLTLTNTEMIMSFLQEKPMYSPWNSTFILEIERTSSATTLGLQTIHCRALIYISICILFTFFIPIYATKFGTEG